MKLTIERVLKKSRDEVWRAFDNPDNLRVWQPTLVSFEHVSGQPGKPGAVSKLTYLEDGRSIVLTETVTARRPPEEMSGTYESSMAWNGIRNIFLPAMPIDHQSTHWTMEIDFRFRGIFKLLAPLMRGAIRRRMNADIDRFKQALESGQFA